MACPVPALSECRAGLPGVPARTRGQALGFRPEFRSDLQDCKGAWAGPRVLSLSVRGMSSTMKIVRFSMADEPPSFGVVIGDHAVAFACLQRRSGMAYQ